SKDIISGRITSNVQNAISFNLGNNTNYRTVFGTGQPYNLLGRGDGVMKIEGYPKDFQRFQSAIISPDESLEEEVYENMKEYFSNFEVEPVLEIEEGEDLSLIEETEEILNKEPEDLTKMKTIIAT